MSVVLLLIMSDMVMLAPLMMYVMVDVKTTLMVKVGSGSVGGGGDSDCFIVSHAMAMVMVMRATRGRY